MVESGIFQHITLILLIIGCIQLGLLTFNINILNMLIPKLAVWIERGIAVFAGYLLYTTYLKR
jgi:hypothetical protein